MSTTSTAGGENSAGIVSAMVDGDMSSKRKRQDETAIPSPAPSSITGPASELSPGWTTQRPPELAKNGSPLAGSPHSAQSVSQPGVGHLPPGGQQQHRGPPPYPQQAYPPTHPSQIKHPYQPPHPHYPALSHPQSQVPQQPPSYGHPINRDYYSSDDEDDDDDMEEEEIEREPLPGEKILPRMRRAGMDSDGDRGTDPLGEVDELESGGENGNATGEKKVARRGPPKITLVVNKGKGKDGVPQADGRRRKKAGTGEESASKRRKTGQNGSEGTPGPTGSVPPKSRLGLAQNEIRIPSPRRPGVRRADRPRRPPPLEMSSGNRELPPPSAGMMSSMRNSGMVSPVVSGFPLHQADQTTRHAFRVAMHIKDAQRRLISDRKLGATPAFHEVPGSGPPPSAGPLPTLLTYIPPPLTGESGGSVADRRGDGVKNKVKGMRLSTGDMSSVRDGLRTAPAGRFGDEGPLAAEEEDELRETAGYDAFGRSYYEMDKQRQAMPPGPFGGEGGSEQPGKGRGPRTAHPGIAASMQKQQGGQGPNNQSHPPSLHIPPFQRPGMQLPPPPQLSERRFSQSTGEGGRGPPHLLPHPPPFYPYPPPGPLGRGMPPLPPGFASQYDRDRDMFMAHFSKFYDALLDSTQLRNDLATKIHKANELVGAHQVELRKVENLRIQYEAALADLKVRSEKLLGSPLAEPAGTSAAESAEEKGSEPVDETENVMEEPAKEAESTTQPEQPEQQETNETQPQETIPVVEASPVADSADVDADAEGDVEMEATSPILP